MLDTPVSSPLVPAINPTAATVPRALRCSPLGDRALRVLICACNPTVAPDSGRQAMAEDRGCFPAGWKGCLKPNEVRTNNWMAKDCSGDVVPEHPDCRIHAAMNARRHDNETHLDELEWQQETAVKHPPLQPCSCCLGAAGELDVVSRIPAGTDRVPPTFAELFKSIALPEGGTLHSMLVIAATAAAAAGVIAVAGDKDEDEDEVPATEKAAGCSKASDAGAGLAGRLTAIARRVAGNACRQVGWVENDGNCLLHAAAAALRDRGLLGGLGLSAAVDRRANMLQLAAAELRAKVSARMLSSSFQSQHRARHPGECFDPQTGELQDYESVAAEGTAFAVSRTFATPLAVAALAQVTGVDIQTVVVDDDASTGWAETHGHGPDGELGGVSPLRIVWDQSHVHFWAALQGNVVLPEFGSHRRRAARSRDGRSSAS